MNLVSVLVHSLPQRQSRCSGAHWQPAGTGQVRVMAAGPVIAIQDVQAIRLKYCFTRFSEQLTEVVSARCTVSHCSCEPTEGVAIR